MLSAHDRWRCHVEYRLEERQSREVDELRDLRRENRVREPAEARDHVGPDEVRRKRG